MKKMITFSHSGGGIVKEEQIISHTLGKLFTATGALYNTSKNCYQLNDLNDISEKEMTAIYCNQDAIDKLHLSQVLRYYNFRTILPCRKEVGIRLKDNPLKGYYSFADSQLEVLKFSYEQTHETTATKELLPVASLDGTFYNCHKLRVIYPMDVSKVENISITTFKGCSNLKELRLHGLNSSLNIEDSPLVCYDSLLYIVTNSNNNTAKEITVHPKTYEYLMGEQSPTSEVGGTASSWKALPTNATTKNIVFKCGEATT